MTDGALQWAAAGRALPGTGGPSGDRSLVLPSARGALLAVVDGLGHGQDAALAAEAAVRALEEDAGRGMVELISRCHEALRSTRGVAASVVAYDLDSRMLTWAGVGNVAAVLVRAGGYARPAREALRSQPGVLGYRISRPKATWLHVDPGDLLVLATDGIKEDFTDGIDPQLAPQELADRLLERFARPSDDAQVLVVRFGPR